MTHVSCFLVVAVFVCAPHAGASAASAQRPTSVEATVVARVNGESITRAELQRFLANAAERRQIQQEVGEEARDPRLRQRAALRTLIHRRLLLQEAARRKLTIADQALDGAVSALRRRFQDLESLGAWMKDHHVDHASLVESLRADLLVARVTAALVEHVALSTVALQEYYDAHAQELKTDDVWLQVIAVKDEAAAKTIAMALRKGDNFAALARDWSIGAHAAQGGDVGWINAQALAPALRQAVSALTPGQSVGPLATSEGSLVVRLHQRRLGRTKTLDEARPDIEQRLLPAMQRETVQAWLAERESHSTITIEELP